jgi:hypothetical protein
MLIAVDQSDSPPASQVVEAFGVMCQEVQSALSRWNDLRTKDLPGLQAARQPVTPPALAQIDCGH